MRARLVRSCGPTSPFLRHPITQDGISISGGREPSAPVHDPLCIAFLLRPDVITSSGGFPLSVETAGERTLGQMIVDTRPWAPAPANATVAFAASVDLLREVPLEGFAVDLRKGKNDS